jgi:hypothetical protein
VVEIVPGAFSRADYRDRNYSDVSLRYSATGVSPHGVTGRGSKTITTGKAGMAEAVFLALRRNAVAAPVGKVWAYVSYTPSGGSSDVLAFCSLPETNLVGDLAVVELTLAKKFGAGDALSIQTTDAGTGGSVDYYTAVFLSEYDP